MNYRNAKRISNGRIDCEIEHETYGWIPFTCDPNDTGALFDTAAFYATMDADPETAAYVPPTQAELDAAAVFSLSFPPTALATDLSNEDSGFADEDTF
jgi:hypothetical protein